MAIVDGNDVQQLDGFGRDDEPSHDGIFRHCGSGTLSNGAELDRRLAQNPFLPTALGFPTMTPGFAMGPMAPFNTLLFGSSVWPMMNVFFPGIGGPQKSIWEQAIDPLGLWTGGAKYSAFTLNKWW